MLCFWSFREARWPALVQKEQWFQAPLFRTRGKRETGQPVLKCRTRRIEAPPDALFAHEPL